MLSHKDKTSTAKAEAHIITVTCLKLTTMYTRYERENRTTLIYNNIYIIVIGRDRRRRCYYNYYCQTFSTMTAPNIVYRISDLIAIKTQRVHYSITLYVI